MTKIDEKSIRQNVQVVNRTTHKPTSNDIYIGNGGIFASPFTYEPTELIGVTQCDSREEAVHEYKEYLKDVIDDFGCKYKILNQNLRKLVLRVKFGKKLNLVCVCSPDPCHGDVIREYIIQEALK